jgi:hypothetical protein
MSIKYVTQCSVKKLQKGCKKVVKKLSKSFQSFQKAAKNCQKATKSCKKVSKSCQKVAKKWQKVVKKVVKNSVKGRRRRRRRRKRRRRIFVVPRPGTTLSHLVKIGATLKRIVNGYGIPSPELLNPFLGTWFRIYKSRGIGNGIPLGTTRVTL